MRPHRRQPTRLPRPWDSPGKNTGVGCHGLLQCMKVKREREVAQSCSILPDPMDCSLPGSSAHGIFQARGLEWGAIAFSSVGDYSSHLQWIHNIFHKVSHFAWLPCTILVHDVGFFLYTHILAIYLTKILHTALHFLLPAPHFRNEFLSNIHTFKIGNIIW